MSIIIPFLLSYASLVTYVKKKITCYSFVFAFFPFIQIVTEISFFKGHLYPVVVQRNRATHHTGKQIQI